MGEQVAAGYIWGCSSVGRAPALQAGGHEFESHHLHESNEPCQDRGRKQIVLAQISFIAVLNLENRIQKIIS